MGPGRRPFRDSPTSARHDRPVHQSPRLHPRVVEAVGSDGADPVAADHVAVRFARREVGASGLGDSTMRPARCWSCLFRRRLSCASETGARRAASGEAAPWAGRSDHCACPFSVGRGGARPDLRGWRLVPSGRRSRRHRTAHARRRSPSSGARLVLPRRLEPPRICVVLYPGAAVSAQREQLDREQPRRDPHQRPLCGGHPRAGHRRGGAALLLTAAVGVVCDRSVTVKSG